MHLIRTEWNALKTKHHCTQYFSFHFTLHWSEFCLIYEPSITWLLHGIWFQMITISYTFLGYPLAAPVLPFPERCTKAESSLPAREAAGFHQHQKTAAGNRQLRHLRSASVENKIWLEYGNSATKITYLTSNTSPQVQSWAFWSPNESTLRSTSFH